MAEPELDLVAHELSTGESILGTEECFCECTVPPGEECYTCYSCGSVCDASPGEGICSTCYCDCAIAGNDGPDGRDGPDGDDDGGGGNYGDDGASESV